jgi:transposase
MTSKSSTTSPVVRVAIDVAKLTHQVLNATGQRRSCVREYKRRSTCRAAGTGYPCEVAFEPTGDYHRPLAHVRQQPASGASSSRRSHAKPA